jgi:ligand-binding sensor domain-containing protein/AraC-like DNA-binding protein
LSSNTVRAVVQDQFGLIWLGTANGLDSFDGREIIHHLPTEGEVGSVQCLLADAEGVLWVGTDDAVYRYADDNLTRIPDFPAVNVTCFAEDREGNVWIGTWENGVYRYRDGVLTGFLDGHKVESVFVSRDGRLWVADISVAEGLLLYKAADQAFVSPGLTFNGCAPARVCAIDEDGNGSLWLGTWNSGLYRLDVSSRTVHLAVPSGNGLNHIHSLMHERNWNFLVGSDDGLLELNPLTGERKLYRNDRTNPASLSDKFVYPLLRDHEGGLWAGTYYGGLNYVSPNVGQFAYLSLSDLLDADEDYIVSCFCEDPDGSLWIGSDNGGLFRYDPARNVAGRWTGTPAWTERLAGLNIHALVRDGNDLWIGTYSENLVRLDVRTGKIQVYGRDEGLDAASAYALCMDRDGILWAGTNTGICRYNAAADRFVLDRAAGDWIIDIRADADGSLWFATSRTGVLRRRADATWAEYTVDNGLPSNYVYTLLTVPGGVFAGTRKGLARLSETRADTLLDGPDVLNVTFDGTDLWMSTDIAVLRLSPGDGRLEQFGGNDGIYANLFSPNSGTVTRDGRICLGASDGFVSFFPGGVRGNEIVPPVLFTGFQASGPGLSENVFETRGHDHIVLPWRMRDVRISFAALSYCAPENNRYAYQLDGLDPHWKDLGNENVLVLNQLPAGRYHLQVAACNNSGVWNRDGASLSFTIRPHPLLSSIAVTLYALLTGILFWLVVRWLLRRAERKSQAQFEQRLDAAVSIVKEEERDGRLQFISSLSGQLEPPLAGIGVQLDRLKELPRTTPAVKGGLSVIEKNLRSLRSLAGNLQQMRQTLSPDAATGEEPDAQKDFLLRLDKLITENIANPDLSVVFLAQEMAISRSGLFTKTKELCGETPNKLINQARLNLAAKLLSEGRHSIGEICYMAGFSSPSYFSKSFVAQFGVTPHEWMKIEKEQQGQRTG